MNSCMDITKSLCCIPITNSLFFQLIYLFWLEDNILQCCDGFCHTSTWIGHRYTCVMPILNPLPTSLPTHPFGLSQNTSFACFASCLKLALLICFIYSNVCPCFSGILSNHNSLLLINYTPIKIKSFKINKWKFKTKLVLKKVYLCLFVVIFTQYNKFAISFSSYFIASPGVHC